MSEQTQRMKVLGTQLVLGLIFLGSLFALVTVAYVSTK